MLQVAVDLSHAGMEDGCWSGLLDDKGGLDLVSCDGRSIDGGMMMILIGDD